MTFEEFQDLVPMKDEIHDGSGGEWVVLVKELLPGEVHLRLRDPKGGWRDYAVKPNKSGSVEVTTLGDTWASAGGIRIPVLESPAAKAIKYP